MYFFPSFNCLVRITRRRNRSSKTSRSQQKKRRRKVTNTNTNTNTPMSIDSLSFELKTQDSALLFATYDPNLDFGFDKYLGLHVHTKYRYREQWNPANSYILYCVFYMHTVYRSPFTFTKCVYLGSGGNDDRM